MRTFESFKTITVQLTLDDVFQIASGLLTEADHQEKAAASCDELLDRPVNPLTDVQREEFKALPYDLRATAARNRFLANDLKRRAMEAGDTRYMLK